MVPSPPSGAPPELLPPEPDPELELELPDEPLDDPPPDPEPDPDDPELDPDPDPDPDPELDPDPDPEELEDPELEPDPDPELEPLPPLLLPLPPANICSCAREPLNSSASPPELGSVLAVCQNIQPVHTLGRLGQLAPQLATHSVAPQSVVQLPA